MAVAVQQRVVGADGGADEGYDEAFLLTVADEHDDDEADGGYWWWQSEVGKPKKWKVPQWEVLAAKRAGWEAGLKKARASEETGVC
jgi:hypothetical protein